MGMTENQNYEVQVYQRNCWQVHARYTFYERTAALHDAKALDKERKNLPIRVIMEDYDPRSGRHKEVLIYRNKIDASKANSHSTSHKTTRRSVGRVGYGVDEYDDDFLDLFEDKVKPKSPISAWKFLGISSMILMISIASAALATGAFAFLLNGFDIQVTDTMRKALLIGVFISIFLIAAMSSIQHYALRFDLNPFKGKKKPSPIVTKNSISKEMEKAAKAIDEEPLKKVIKEEVPPSNIFDDLEIQEEDIEIFSSKAEQQKMFLIKFLGNCLGALKGTEPNANKLNRFGMNLFMTGSVISTAKVHNLSDDETTSILQSILEMLGAKPDQASRFSLEYEKYLSTPRHLELFETGGRCAVNFSDGDQSAPLYIQKTIDDWLNWSAPIDEIINPNQLTVMFTDMVGSTDLTSRHGDYAAQEVLKTHDLIVRTALTNIGGKEIKHLGDGIMASFKDHNLAIQAAIEIQKRVSGNNNASPEFPLHLRIGLNTGEPIKKDNDLFGSAVQLAARLCDKAISDGILVSHNLRHLCDEKSPFTFIDIGTQELKGFNQPIALYQIDWSAAPIIYETQDQATSSERSRLPAKPGEENSGFDVDYTLEKTDQPIANIQQKDNVKPQNV